MAGDWIKFELTTLDKPEVCQIADLADIDLDAVIGKLMRVWGWFDQQTESGNAPSVSKKLLDRLVGVIGFCEHMKSVGWMVEAEGVISLPHFERHNGKTAKNRLLTAKRVANHKSANAKSNAKNVSGALPKEDVEKNKEPLSTHEPVDPRMPSEMTLAWVPDAKLLKTYAVHAGIALDLITEDVRRAFTAHYESTGQVNTQKEWVQMLVKWVARDKARTAASNVRPFPGRPSGGAGPDFDDTTWADDLGGAL
ncbi:DnaT-like ssDNA-binding domain-containing protein [Pseudomonas sp. GD03860]|uniref:DnaT-like ssDNA-binding domain-containing protein n=1 Tax=Pseudomonas sp. GD03860 TaxID=2975389 RepID=UPI002447908D|nr:DnaT-like ssDNA-binding domain-containing protein [Pseudomonas sp. GD03860]MDH0640640.1 DnaT-like ssDNA-binding domain-containing protein [Pseudomonas sp. GD03860]